MARVSADNTTPYARIQLHLRQPLLTLKLQKRGTHNVVGICQSAFAEFRNAFCRHLAYAVGVVAAKIDAKNMNMPVFRQHRIGILSGASFFIDIYANCRTSMRKPMVGMGNFRFIDEESQVSGRVLSEP